MKIRVEIELFSAGAKANIYAVRLWQQDKPEAARFFDRIMRQLATQPAATRLRSSLSVILDYLERISRLDGAQERFFRPREGRGLALPVAKGLLRLYCYRMDNSTLIICGGGLKEGDTVQQSPDCLPHFNLMNNVIDELKRRRILPANLPAASGESLTLYITPPPDHDYAS